MATTENFEAASAAFQELQNKLSATISEVASGQPHREDQWKYSKGKGGGITRVWSESQGQLVCSRDSHVLWGRGGCNYSKIEGTSLPSESLGPRSQEQEQEQGQENDTKRTAGSPFKATGVSLILHATNPWVPSVHANVRLFWISENTWWFGGGIDMTPVYPLVRQVRDFHRRIKQTYDRFPSAAFDYDAHKAGCDEYFYLPHRQETRGVGGVFFDKIGYSGAPVSFQEGIAFVLELADSLHDLIRDVAQNQYYPFTEEMQAFCNYRRGRYVEFNLLYDRGTRFGLSSSGRTESILISLPETVAFRYNWQPETTMEQYLYNYFLKPRDWIHDHDLRDPEEYKRFKKSTVPQLVPTFIA